MTERKPENACKPRNTSPRRPMAINMIERKRLVMSWYWVGVGETAGVLKHIMSTARKRHDTATGELGTRESLEGKAWALPTLSIPIVERTMRTGKTADGGRKIRMRKSTISDAKAVIGNTFCVDFCLTQVKLRKTDKITHEITIKNLRNDSSCS